MCEFTSCLCDYTPSLSGNLSLLSSTQTKNPVCVETYLFYILFVDVCSVLQCVAVCCNVLQCKFLFVWKLISFTLKHLNLRYTCFWCVDTCLVGVITHPVCVQIYLISCVNTLQHTATHCNILQHTATHCKILQNCLYLISVVNTF